MSGRIYLDNAATSWPKPPEVLHAVSDYMQNNGTSVGRGTYREAIASAQITDNVRYQLKQILGLPPSGHVAFCYSGTDAANLCIHGFLRPGDRVVTSDAEHNAILRPLEMARRKLQIQIDFVPVDRTGEIDLDRYQDLLKKSPRLVAITHVSNVTGGIQPVETICQLAKTNGAAVLLDVCQSAGHVPITCQSWQADMVIGSGHKGLLGPLGTGFAGMTREAAADIAPLRQGGTGSSSESPEQPQSLPEKFEAGNLNAPGIAGLGAGIQFVVENSAAIRRAGEWAALAAKKLAELDRVTVLGPSDPHLKTAVVCFTLDGWDCHEAAQALEIGHGLQLRAGLHCAPRIHQTIGAAAGSLRASFGAFNTADDAEILVRGVRELSAMVR